MQLVFRPEAQRELLEAQAWYEKHSPGLGFEFARAVDVAVARAIRTPLAFPSIEGDFRRVLTRKFPYPSSTTHQEWNLSWCLAFITAASQARGLAISSDALIA